MCSGSDRYISGIGVKGTTICTKSDWKSCQELMDGIEHTDTIRVIRGVQIGNRNSIRQRILSSQSHYILYISSSGKLKGGKKKIDSYYLEQWNLVRASFILILLSPYILYYPRCMETHVINVLHRGRETIGVMVNPLITSSYSTVHYTHYTTYADS